MGSTDRRSSAIDHDQQLTIRELDAELEQRIRQLAREEDISLNRAAIRLLRLGAGLGKPSPPPGCVGDSLDDLIGTWSDDEARAMREAEQDFEQVDPALWR